MSSLDLDRMNVIWSAVTNGQRDDLSISPDHAMIFVAYAFYSKGYVIDPWCRITTRNLNDAAMN